MPDWRCRSCLTMNAPRKRRCQACEKLRPKKRQPAHRVALKQPLEAFVAANDGLTTCWICDWLGIRMEGTPQRDHWHNGPLAGRPRGILCPFHNRKLGAVYTPELVGAMLAYLRRAQEHTG